MKIILRNLKHYYWDTESGTYYLLQQLSSKKELTQAEKIRLQEAFKRLYPMFMLGYN